MGKLLETINEQEQSSQETVIHKSAAKKIMSSSKKDRQLSVKITNEMFNQFTQINQSTRTLFGQFLIYARSTLPERRQREQTATVL